MVYRYLRDVYAMQALESGYWKVGRISELNDPMDCSPGWSHPDPDVEATVVGMMGKYGILCYSETVTDPVLWSHYSDSHRGMALGFDFPEHEAPLEVRYAEDNAKAILDSIEVRKLLESIEAAPQKGHKVVILNQALARFIQDGYTTKAKSWKYEREQRHFIKLASCSLRWPHYFRKAPWEHLRKIVIGAKSIVSFDEVDCIVRDSPHLNEAVIAGLQILRARTQEMSYNLELVDGSGRSALG